MQNADAEASTFQSYCYGSDSDCLFIQFGILEPLDEPDENSNLCAAIQLYGIENSLQPG